MIDDITLIYITNIHWKDVRGRYMNKAAVTVDPNSNEKSFVRVDLSYVLCVFPYLRQFFGIVRQSAILYTILCTITSKINVTPKGKGVRLSEKMQLTSAL